MSWRTQIGFTGVFLALALAVPTEAAAQSGLLEYIFRLSGPSYAKVVTGRVSVCVTRPFCLEGLFGPAATRRDDGTERRVEPQVGLAVTYGWDGDNDDKGISDTSMLVLEPQARLVLPGVPVYYPRVFSAGIGFHRFSGGTVSEEFWETAFVGSAAWRIPESVEDERWFVEGGIKVRSFFDRLVAGDFGGNPNDDESELINWGLFLGAGYRFDFE